MNSTIDLKTILDLHAKWLRNEPEGRRADLRGADLGGADLGGADLRRAYLGGAYLGGADLRSANLGGAYLGGADLRSADLRSANLRGAYLGGADLRSANLRGADLGGAYLRSANLGDADLGGAYLRDCKEVDLALATSTHLPDGPFHAWKQCRNKVIVKLLIPANARRSHGCERKCRAEYAKVLQVIGADVGISIYDGKTEYRKGQMVYPDGWDEDRWNTCGQGIHFYLTRLEAENN